LAYRGEPVPSITVARGDGAAETRGTAAHTETLMPNIALATGAGSG